MKKENTIASYIGSGCAEVLQDEVLFTLAVPDLYLQSEAMGLLHTFTSVMGIRFSDKGIKGFRQSNLLHFMKLARRLEKWKLNGVRISPTNYMLAHKWFYGNNIYVGHLIGPKSFEICQSYMRMKKAIKIRYTQEDYESYDADVIKNLSVIRKETQEETQEILEMCGLM